MDPAARIGTTLKGKWRIDRLLGTGGFASVYAATHRAGKRVAIKVLHAALGASEEVRRRFLREAYAANAVDHPAVVGVSDDDVTDDGAPFLVMDLLEGETADARRKAAGGRLHVADVMLLAEEVLSALVAAHDKGIVHRDLKPENLFMTKDGHVKILDFGIARFREPGDESTATQTGLTMGSPAFMAPEQARGRWSEVDVRTDVYALGATLFVLLTGRLVHGKQNLNEALINAATKPAPEISSVMPGLPAEVAAVIDRALAFEKEKRWPSAAAMRDAVRLARASLSAEAHSLGATGTVPLGALPAPGPAFPRSGVDLNTAYSVAAGATGPADVATATAPLPQLVSSPRNTEIAALGLPGNTPVTTSPPVSTTQAPITRRPTWPLVAGASAGVVALGLAAALLWARTRPAPGSDASAGEPLSAPAVSASAVPSTASDPVVVAPTVTPGTTASATEAPSPSKPPEKATAPTASPPPVPKATATTPAKATTSPASAKPAPAPSKTGQDDLRSNKVRR